MTDPATRQRNPLFNANRLKLGTFGTNGRGSAHTLAPDRYTPTWENAIAAAKGADRLGMEAIVAYARWKGVAGGPMDHLTGVSLDPFTFAAGVAQATNYSAVLATSHAPTTHPIVVAKQCATIDIISGGRFGLNVVGGWNAPEFAMFGSPLADHDVRYEYLEEWLHVLKMLWMSNKEFDFEGKFLKLTGAMSMPHPIQQPPPIMNAGSSKRGQQFACKNADLCFVTSNVDPEIARREHASYKRVAREEFGRDVFLWTTAIIVQRQTREAAEEYFNYFAVEHQDRMSIDGWLAMKGDARDLNNKRKAEDPSRRRLVAAGGRPMIGTARDIADELEKLQELGIDGCLLTWNNFSDGLDRFGEVMPLLEQRGLRDPFPASEKPAAASA